MERGRITKKYLAAYTGLFLLLACAVFAPFVLADKSLIGNGDGQSQYILQLARMGRWLRDAFSGFLHGDFTPARFDFTIGMGDDINAVVRFHPLDFLSVFVPAAHTEALYNSLSLLRLYLAGISFSVFAFSFRRDTRPLGVLLGSMVYLFTGYTFSLGIVHPVYLSPLITLPLLLMGAERMMREPQRHRFVLLTLITAVSFISNYYFMYIASVTLLMYVTVRFFQLYKQNRVRSFLLLFVRMASAYLLGVLLAAWTLFPTLTRYLTSYRSERITLVSNLLIYSDRRRYLAWILNLISPLRASGNGTHLNFTVLVFPALILLFVKSRKQDLTKERAQERIFLRIASAVLLAFLLIPFGGYLMAVMNNENNRWVFLIALLLGAVVSFETDELCMLGKKERRALAAGCILFDLAVVLEQLLITRDLYNAAGAAQLTLAVAALLIFCRKKTEAFPGTASDSPAAIGICSREDGCRRGAALALTMIVCVSTVLNGIFTFGSSFGNLTRYYKKLGTSLSTYSNSAYSLYNEVGADSFYRVDGIFAKNNEDNAALWLGYPGVQMYNSILNRYEIEALDSTDNIGLTTMLHVHNLDGRPALSALASVRYFMTDDANRNSVPPGYSKEPVVTKGDKSIYENEHPLSLSFGTDSIMLRSEFEKLTQAQKEEALLEVTVIGDEDADASARADAVTAASFAEESGADEVTVPLPEGADGIRRTKDGYKVTRKMSTLSLTCERRPGYDCYLYLKGLVSKDGPSRLYVKTDGVSKQAILLTMSETYTFGRDSYMIRLGGSEQASSAEVTVSLRDKGRYKLGGISFLYLPTGDYTEKIDALNAAALTDTSINDDMDTVTGRADRAKAGVEVFSIPYSSGWSAEVNGKKADTVCADLAFLGVELPEGTSRVKLVYRTPGGETGRRLTMAGMLLLLAAAAILARRRRKA